MYELDFKHEARNMERFAKQFQGNRSIRVPHVYREFTTERVLVMEFISGHAVDRPDELRAHHIDPVKLSEKISKLIYQQMFQLGFFHGDPHPGNIAILPGGVTCLYDYGMMGNLSMSFRELIASMIVGLVEKDQRKVMRSVLGMSMNGFTDDPNKFEDELEGFSRHYLDVPLKDLKLGFILNRLLELLMDFKLRMKPDFYLGIKALSQVEDIAVKLNPNLNFLKLGEPFALEVIESKYDILNLLKNVYSSLTEGFTFFKDLPVDLQDLYERIRRGKYSIPIEHKINPEGFEPLRNTMNHIANRLTDAILSAAFLISSALLILADVAPKWRGMSLFGFIGLTFGCLLGLRIFLSIRKRGGL
jgi:ubiquinone biosynthesis protein